MILDSITLHNFGAYKNRQTIELRPPSPDKPVVLFGGLNGGGKTTLLNALQLVLYGKQARCSNRNQFSYEEYLRRSIHRNSGADEGAALELQFRRHEEGRLCVYQIHRSWRPTGKGIKETLEINRDGKPDKALEANWSERVHEFLPARLSQLFFFDGDRIEELADPEKSANLLKSAVHSLLKLDQVDRLSRDLHTLEKRKRISVKPAKEQAKLEGLQKDLEQLEAERTRHVEERASEQTTLDRFQGEERSFMERFQEEGGELFERRSLLEQTHETKKQDLDNDEQQLREIATGALPLQLVGDLLAKVSQDARAENDADTAGRTGDMLAKRDQNLLTELASLKVPSATQKKISLFLDKDRENRAKKAAVNSYLELPQETQGILAKVPDLLTSDSTQASTLVEKISTLKEELLSLERQLASVPEKSSIEQLIKEREAAKKNVHLQEAKLELRNEEIARHEKSIDAKNREILSELEMVTEGDILDEEAKRILDHTKRVQTTLSKFRTSVLSHHVNRIETSILESLSELLRKHSLLNSLKLDPETFELELRDKDDILVTADRLSMGERQLLAIAMLWGLARASDHALPAIIDTPLSRLDLDHKSHLVERYFPQASHQVILLSTNTEIDERYYQELKPFIGREYMIVFDDKTSTTSVEPGYFW